MVLILLAMLAGPGHPAGTRKKDKGGKAQAASPVVFYVLGGPSTISCDGGPSVPMLQMYTMQDYRLQSQT